MKKLALFVMLMGLGMFTLGCGEAEKAKTPPADAPVVEEGAETDAPAEEADAPAEEKTDAPAEEKKAE